MSQFHFQQSGLTAAGPINSRLRYAFIISLVIHLLAVTIIAIFFFKGRYEPEDFISVDIIQTVIPEFRRPRLLTPQKFALPKDILSPEINAPNLVNLEKPRIFDKPLSQTNITLFSDAMVIRDINPIALNISNSGLARSGASSTYGTSSTTDLVKNRTLISSTRTDKSTKPIIPEISKSINLMSHIDTLSQPELPMENNIDAVINHLSKMADIFQAGGLDFTIGIVTFRYGTFYSLLGWDMKVFPQTADIKKVKQELRSIKCRGDEKALDAQKSNFASLRKDVLFW